MIGTPSAIVSDDALKMHRQNILDAIQAGLREKNRVYTPGASEILKFYNGQHKYLFNAADASNQISLFINQDPLVGDKAGVRQPIFQMSNNVAAKYLQIYSPYLLQGIVRRTVEARKIFLPPPAYYGIDPEPMQVLKLQMMANIPNGRMQAMMYWQQQQQAAMQMQVAQLQAAQMMDVSKARADMMEMILNYTPGELGYENERKRVVEESLILGGGIWLTQIVPLPQYNAKMIGSQYVMMADIVWDPDATRAKDCKWMAISYRAPVWLVSRIFGVPEKDIRATQGSVVNASQQQSLIFAAGPEAANRQIPQDEVTYWKFWSRMGSGARLKPTATREPQLELIDNTLGDYTYFVVSEGCDYPLNMGPAVFQAVEAMGQQQSLAALIPGMTPVDPLLPLKQATSWQIPFYLDPDDPWPVTVVEHYLRNGSPYPIPPLEFALAYMKFMVWVISFIADKTYRANRTIIACDATTAEQLRTALEQSQDEAIVEIKGLDGGKTVQQLLAYIEAPPLKKDILEIYSFMVTEFEQMTGMNEINQAQMSRTMRSATEAGILDEASKLRPQAMARNLMNADSRLARKEAIAWHILGTPQDVAPILGGQGAQAWQKMMMSIPPAQLMRETSYDVVASQGRIHDLATRQDQSNRMAQLILPLLVQMATVSGNLGAVRAVIEEWCKANQIDPDKVLPGLPDMPMNPEAGGVASPPAPTSQEGAGP